MMQIGEKINKLTLIKYVGTNKHRQRVGSFKCDCGNIVEIRVVSVKRGATRSCGCLQKEHVSNLGKCKSIDLTGQVFGRLTILYRDKKDHKHYGAYWICKCDCGNVCSVFGVSLRKGNTRSCGCLQKELSRNRQIEKLLDGTSHFIRGNHGWFVSKKQNINIHYDSSYEERALNFWEADSTISSFNRSRDRIAYVNPIDLASHVYIPDFIVDGTRMIEIKPQYKLDDPVVQAKASAAESYCSERGMTYEIWTEHELGLIK